MQDAVSATVILNVVVHLALMQLRFYCVYS
jgi:hypothetical protein